MLKLSDFVKNNLKKSGIISLVLFQLSSIFVYLILFYKIKQNHLDNTLRISSEIISKSFEVGDWDLILSHLNSTNSFANINNLALSLPSNEKLIGPIGIPEHGLWNLCELRKGNLFNIQACTYVISYKELPLFIIFQIFILIGYILVFALVFKRINTFSNYISLALNKLNHFNDLKESTNSFLFEIEEINLLNEKIANLLEKEKIFVETRLKETFMRKISHDIRSPLAALKVVRDISSHSLNSEQTKLLTMSIDRITDIANTILPRNSQDGLITNDKQNCFLWMLIDQIISEKRVEYKKSIGVSIQFHVEGSPFELNAICDSTQFMRSVSNIVNNSIEARKNNHPIQVDLKLFANQNHVFLTIKDNGKGIPDNVLPNIFDEAFSYGKQMGTGLGLFQVKQAVESWGGSIQIESQVDVGTQITISLKKSEKPKWLADSIDTSAYQRMIILDDEEYVSTILQDRFSKYFEDIRYFKIIEAFEEHLATTSNCLIFMDHDLKQSLTGIDLIQKYNLQQQSILLTGNYDDKNVQQKASELGIKILPKPLINDISIEL